MPFTFVEIKKTKTRKLLALFAFLIFFYFLTAFIIATSLKIVFIFDQAAHQNIENAQIKLLTAKEGLIILVIALFAALIHWYFSTRSLTGRILSVLGAEPLDDKDSFHKRFKNIVEELSVAMGGKNIESYVIPTSSKNAFSIMDFSDRAAIGVTEGLLAKLTRAQLEAVVAHEAAHIASGDSLIATVSSSIFGLYAGIMKAMQRSIEKERGYRSSGPNLYFLVIFFILMLAEGMNQLISMFISREKEYRADAVAVELSRNPLSLAEALYIISNSWRGSGIDGENLESLFIMNPSYSALDEKEGFFAELFSTHPPVLKRIGVLLALAHTNMNDVISSVKSANFPERKFFEDSPGVVKTADNYWFINTPDGKWDGPFDINGLKALKWFMPQAWVKKSGEEAIKPAFEDETLNNYFRGNIKNISDLNCPSCKNSLSEIAYEEAEIYQCKFCKGALVEKDKISRILSRNLEGFKDEVIKMADSIKKVQNSYNSLKLKLNLESHINCPKCNRAMERAFYSPFYLVEIDRCNACNLMWFDKFELEVLQKLYEENEIKTG